MPGINKIRVIQKKLVKFFTVYTNHFGVYCDPYQKIKDVCQKILDRSLSTIDKFFIKLSCDGTIITKSFVHLLNFTFTVINEKNFCQTAEGNFMLGII